MSDQDEKKGFTVKDKRRLSEDAPAEEPTEEARSLPEVDFATFVLSLASSAFLHLGQMPHPDTQKVEPNLPLAKQTIDILGMLQGKTRGNLSRDEEQLLENLLYDLRLRYVEAAKR
jgi:hypothetical protein